jgi:hypothetical protein
MRAGLAKSKTAESDFADQKLTINQMIEGHGASNNISPAESLVNFHSELSAERVDCFTFNQGQLAIGLRFGKRSAVIEIAIALQSLAGNSTRFSNGLHGSFGCGGDVD